MIDSSAGAICMPHSENSENLRCIFAIFFPRNSYATRSSNRAQISNLNPFVSDIHQLSVLDTEYEDDPIYSAKLENLSTKYKAIRRTRPDGNCFFRAFAYGYLEYLVKQGRHEYEAFRELAEKSKDRLIKLGFPQFTLEDFHDTVRSHRFSGGGFFRRVAPRTARALITHMSRPHFAFQFMTVLESVQPSDNEAATLAEFHRLLNDQGHSDYVVVYLRLITSGQLQEGADFYQNFIDGNCTMEEFRHQEVEPMYKESDHIHIIGRRWFGRFVCCATVISAENVHRIHCVLSFQPFAMR